MDTEKENTTEVTPDITDTKTTDSKTDTEKTTDNDTQEVIEASQSIQSDKQPKETKERFPFVFPGAFLALAIWAYILLLGSSGFADFASLNNDKFAWLSGLLAFLGFGCAAVSAVVCVKKGRPKMNRYFYALLLSANFYFINEFCLYLVPSYIANDGANLRRFIKPYFPNILLGIFMYFIFFFIAVAFTKHKLITRILITLFSAFFAFYAVLQYYIVHFRGGPIRFADLANVTSAGEISDEYQFGFSYMVLFAVADTLIIIALTFIIELSPLEHPVKNRSIGAGVLAAMCVSFYFSAEAVYNYGLNNRIVRLNFSLGEDTDTYQDVGGLLCFYYDGLKNRIKVPDGYSNEEAVSRLEKFETDQTVTRKPTIIAVLNESFADVKHLGDIEVNMDYMPNIRALKEDCIKGYVTVSPYGGYTCNSEFEFLSGNSMYFLPSGSAVYTQFMDQPQDSMVSHLNDLGYHTVALTCCRRGLWKIENAYKQLGFDTAYYSDNVHLTNVTEINGNISDDSIYRRVEKEFERKPKDESMFVWVTTMQNHAPYNSLLESDHTPIDLASPANDQADIYLNSIYQADKAIGDMIEYFKNVDEDVVIVFFGDHYPHISGFYDDMLGSNLDSLPIEEFCKSHQTPYFIWANYDIEEKENSNVSLNYLGIDLMDVCGLPRSDYQNFLDSLRENLPIISSFGYMDGDEQWHKRSDDPAHDTDEMKDLRYLQYYKIFKQHEK